MRTVTNDYDLPLPMFNALSADTYVSVGDISATRLILPPRIATLRKFHENEIVEDASERIWSLLGSSVHRMLELSANPEDRAGKALSLLDRALRELKFNPENAEEEALEAITDAIVVLRNRGEPKKEHIHITAEERLGMPITFMSFEGEEEVWHVTAQQDVFYNKALYDYKVTSTFSLLFGDKPEWEKQVNIQAALHRNHGDTVERGYIVPILRDWQKRKAMLEKEYPPAAVAKISIPMWTQEECIDYIRRRVKLHHKSQVQYGQTKDENVLPMCSDEERWYRGHCYAVKYQDKTGKVNKNAKRKFESKTDALAFMQENMASIPKGKAWAPIEERPGQNIRCESYCDVWKFCSFGRKVHTMNEEREKEKTLVNEEELEELNLA